MTTSRLNNDAQFRWRSTVTWPSLDLHSTVARTAPDSPPATASNG